MLLPSLCGGVSSFHSFLITSPPLLFFPFYIFFRFLASFTDLELSHLPFPHMRGLLVVHARSKFVCPERIIRVLPELRGLVCDCPRYLGVLSTASSAHISAARKEWPMYAPSHVPSSVRAEFSAQRNRKIIIVCIAGFETSWHDSSEYQHSLAVISLERSEKLGHLIWIENIARPVMYEFALPLRRLMNRGIWASQSRTWTQRYDQYSVEWLCAPFWTLKEAQYKIALVGLVYRIIFVALLSQL